MDDPQMGICSKVVSIHLSETEGAAQLCKGRFGIPMDAQDVLIYPMWSYWNQGWNKRRRKWYSLLGSALGATSVVLGLQWAGVWQLSELAVLDHWFRLRPKETLRSPIVLVTLDEEDFKQEGGWPVSDATLAKLLDQIQQQQPRAIGLDLYRNLPTEPGHRELLQVFATQANLIGITKVVNDANGIAVDPPPLLAARYQVAASDLVQDVDGKVRRHLLSVRQRNGETLTTLGARLALMYLESEQVQALPDAQPLQPLEPHVAMAPAIASEPKPVIQAQAQTQVQAEAPQESATDRINLGQAVFEPVRSFEGGYIRADVGGYQILSNFARSTQRLPRVSLRQVLAGQVPPDFMRDRLVLIGSTAESVRDRFYTPYTLQPDQAWFGMELQADLATQIIAAATQGRPLLRGIPELLEFLWLLVWAMVGAWLGWVLPDRRLSLLVLPAGGVMLGGMGYGLFLVGWWVTIVAPGFGFLGAGLLCRGALLWQRLHRTYALLGAYSRNLEQKVFKRTQQLQQQNLQLEQARQQAEASSQAKGKFLAHMSHEFRTPLNAILGFSQLLGYDTTLTVQQQEQVAIINRSGEHLLSLVNDVLEMSKIEAGKVTLNLGWVDLMGLLEALEAMFGLQARSKGLTLAIDLATEVPQYVEADETKLRQVLLNLLGNAVKFTSRGGVTLRLTLQPPPISRLVFAIADTGIGIAQADLAQIFDPFTQAPAGAESQGGTGLGLAISRNFVQLMGGDLTAVSQVGQGSTFQFDLPLVPVAGPIAQEKEPAVPRSFRLGSNQPNYRILVVDDATVNRKLLGRILQNAGFEIYEAENGREAIALWQTWRPDLIMMDMQMPVMSGYEATQAIRAQEAVGDRPLPPGVAPRTPIIAVTASVFEEERRAALAAGCDDFVGKPFKRDGICLKVAQQLGIRFP